MMIDPGYYYEEHLKGRSKEEIMTAIRSLKRQIGSLKRSLEAHDGDLSHISPSGQVMLRMTRKYLDRAIEAYREAGGDYIPSKAERRSAELGEALGSLRSVVFSIGGYFQGYEVRTFIVSSGSVTVSAVNTLDPQGAESRFDSGLTAEEFIEGLRELHIDEWKRSYVYPAIMDGTQWKLEIFFECGRRPLRIYGDNAYPYNFGELLRLLELDAQS